MTSKENCFDLRQALFLLSTEDDRRAADEYALKYQCEFAALRAKPGGATKEDCDALLARYGGQIPRRMKLEKTQSIASCNPILRGLMKALRSGEVVAYGGIDTFLERKKINSAIWSGAWTFHGLDPQSILIKKVTAVSERMKIYNILFERTVATRRPRPFTPEEDERLIELRLNARGQAGIEAIAKTLGRNPSTITGRLRLLGERDKELGKKLDEMRSFLRPEASVHPVIARLRAKRQELNWTRPHLAKVSGYSVVTIEEWERGRRFPPKQSLLNWSQALGMTLAVLESER